MIKNYLLKILDIDSDGNTTAKIIDKLVTPIHKSSQWKPNSPKNVTRMEDITIPKPTPMKLSLIHI